MKPLVSRVFGVLAAALALITLPAVAGAQKALVYCPVGIDAAGCDYAVAALTSAFPDGVDRGYDGSAGTVDVKTTDLWDYAVLVVPSLADGAGKAPYALLRDAAVKERLHDAVMGRVTLWSGTPDLGSTNRAAKDLLIRNLAKWAAGNYGTVKGPGLVAFQDLSETVAQRYDWVKGLTGLTIVADSAVMSYDSVRAMTATGTTILSNGSGGAIKYTNMASLGYYLPQGAAGVTLDAVGQTGTTKGGQVVLLTSPGGNTGAAVIRTDKDDYAPGTVVTITGTGFQPGETVSMVLHEDPIVHDNRTLTSVADGSGSFVNTSFSPEAHDIDVRFILTATGATSGVRAEATFTDGQPQNVSLSPTSVSVAAGGIATYSVNVDMGGNNNSCVVTLEVTTSLPNGVSASFNNNPVTVNPGNVDFTRTLTLTTTNSGPPAGRTPEGVSSPFTVRATRGTGCQGGSADPTANGTLIVTAPTTTSVTSSSNPSTVGGSVTFTATVSTTITTLGVPSGSVQFKVDGANLGSAVAVSPAGTASSGPTTSLALGDRVITAEYTPTSGTLFAASTGTLTQTVKPATAPTTLSVAAASGTYAGTTTLSATLTSGSPATGVSGKSIAFTLNGTSVGSATTNASGVATLSSVSLAGINAATYATGVGASFVGDASYDPSTGTASLTVGKANQATVVVTAPASMTYGQPAVTLTATGGSGTGAYSFSAGASTGCAVAGDQLSVTNATGTCSVTASRAGDANYNASAPSAPATVALVKATASVTFTSTAPATLAYDQTYTPAATTTGDGVLTIGASGACSITSGVVKITAGSGTCTVTASVAAGTNYGAASATPQTITATKATATISLVIPTGAKYTGSPVSATATTTPAGLTGLVVTYDGVASAPTNAGSYAVVAKLTNDFYQATDATGTLVIGKGDQVISWSPPAPITYGTALSGTQLNATLTTGNGALTYDPAAGTVLNAGTHTLRVDAAETANYNGAFATVQLTVNKATPVITWANPSDIDYGTALSGTQLNASVSGVTGTFAYTPDVGAVLGAGTHTLSVTFTPTGADAINYNGATKTATLKVNKAVLTVTAEDKTKNYDGSAFTAFTSKFAGFVNGDAQSVVSGTVTYTGTAVGATDAGTYVITPVVTGLSATNYSFTPVNGTLKIEQVNATIVVQGFSGPYDGAAHSATGTATGVNGENLSSLLNFGASFTNVPGGTANWTFAGNTNYKSASGTATITITKVTPTIVWANPADIFYGTPLGATQLNAAAKGVLNETVAGTFAYSPAAGTILHAGPDQTLTVNFTSTSDNYNDVAATTAKINVKKATPTVTAAGGTYTYDATPHAATGSVTGVVINGSAEALGAPTSFTYTLHGTSTTTTTAPTNAGTYDVVANFAGNSDYEAASSTNAASVVINKATPVFANLAAPSIVYGTATTALSGKLSAGSLVPTGNVSITLGTGGMAVPKSAAIGAAGAFSESFNTATLAVVASPYPIAYSYAGDNNFEAVSGPNNLALTVTAAPLTITADNKTMVFGAATRPPFTVTPTGLVNGETLSALGGTLTFTGTATTVNSTSVAGTYVIIPSGLTSTNYAITFVNGTLTVLDQSAPVVTNVVATPNPVALNAPSPTLTASVTDVGFGSSNIVSVEYRIDNGSWTAMGGFSPAPTVTATATLPTLTTGVYKLCVRAFDGATPRNESAAECIFLAVYDPNGGFVTGGGFIMSPAGAYRLDASLTGKASFGFVAKYLKGQASGETEFQFQAGNLNFHSTAYEWLTVASFKAIYKGSGTINGKGDYGFLISAIDGQIAGGGGVDKFRVKIWDKSKAESDPAYIVYDNQVSGSTDENADPVTGLAGGSISIKSK